MLRPWFWCAISVFGLFILATQNSEAGPSKRRPKIGLALSGGGARGIAHIGVLRSLEKLHVPIDAIAGTSIGSFVGALYSAGYTVDEIERIFRDSNWQDILFNDRVARKDLPYRRKIDYERYLFDLELGFRDGKFMLPPALTTGHKLGLLLDSVLIRVADIQDFSKLPIPFQAVATDLESGRMIVLNHGNLATAVRASSAFPGFFSPVEIDGHLLLDGGSTNNLPIDVARKMGVDAVIGVDISSPLYGRHELSNFLDISDQFVTIMMRSTTESQRDKADVLLVPKITEERTFYFKTIEQIVSLGEQETEKNESRLKRYAISSSEYEDYQKKRRAHQFQPGVLHEVETRGFRRVDTKTIEHHLRFKKESQFHLIKLEEDLNEIYSLGDFQRVGFQFTQISPAPTLTIEAVEKPWGPNYIHFAVTWDGEIKGKQDGNAIMNVRMTRLNRLNAEWTSDIQLGTFLELDSEFYQPLNYSGLFFVAPRIYSSRSHQDFYVDQNRTAQYEIDSVAGEIDLGLDLRKYGELRGGFRKGLVISEVDLGTPIVPGFQAQTGAFVGQFRLDRLDSAYFPSNGVYTSLDYYMSQHWLAAEQAYRKMSTQLHSFYGFNRNTFFFSLYGGTSFGSSVPVYDQFLLGGFRSLGGYREEELRGKHYATSRVGYLFRLPVPQTILWNRIFIGGWAEAGNMWIFERDVGWDNLLYSGTFAVGFDTKLGPVFLAYGQSGEEHKQFYVSVGRTFGIRKPQFY